MQDRRRGFTLVELLIVIAIIALLMTIIAPALSTARERALDIICGSNIRQLGIGMAGYAADNRQFAPWRNTIMGWWCEGDPLRLRQSAIFPYLSGSEKIFLCPVFQKLPGAEQAVFSYTENWNIGSNIRAGDMWSEEIQIGQMRKPSELALFCEENPWPRGHPVYATFSMNDGQMCAPDWPWRDTFATFHRPLRERYFNAIPSYVPTEDQVNFYTGISHVVFVDGHVDWRISVQTERDCHNDPSRIRYPQPE